MRYETILPLYRFLWKHWREKRYELFRQILAPEPIGRLLDVGGGASHWYGRSSIVRRVDCLNVGEPHPVKAPPGSPEITILQGDGRRLHFETSSYEVVYSNSVIEHVGSWDDQRAFATEVRRVGRSLWIQTPAYECPLEPHYLGPPIHWLPERMRWFAARWLTVVGLTNAAGRDGLRSIMQSTRLLRKREFSELFPDCEIRTERLFLLFPKSYIAIRRQSPPQPEA
jgi:hypothetical protein